MKLSIFRFRINPNDNFKFISFLDMNDEKNIFEESNDKEVDIIKEFLEKYLENNGIITFNTQNYLVNGEHNNQNDKFTIQNLNNMYCGNNGNYTFDLQYALFDNLSEIGEKYIDSIIRRIQKEDKKEYINRKLWKKYNIYPLNLSEEDLIGIYPTDGTLKHDKNNFEFINSLEEIKEILYKLCDSFDSTKSFGKLTRNFKEFIGFELSPKTEIDTINYFFEMIFWFNIPFIIRKCEDCGKYFICRSGNTHTCNRIGSDGMICSERKDKIRRQHERNEPIKKLLKKVRDHLRYDEVKYQKFCDENYKKKKELFGKDKEYIEWLLAYFDKNKQQDIINKIDGLEDYLK